jgi:hypothetical protein
VLDLDADAPPTGRKPVITGTATPAMTAAMIPIIHQNHFVFSVSLDEGVGPDMPGLLIQFLDWSVETVR